MNYKGIEYRVLQTTTHGVWAWSFDPPKSIPVHGKTNGTRASANASVESAINNWIETNGADQAC
jgi:hypothetical protein